MVVVRATVVGFGILIFTRVQTPQLTRGLRDQPTTTTEDPDPNTARTVETATVEYLKKLRADLQATPDVQTQTTQNMMDNLTNSSYNHLMAQLQDAMNFRNDKNNRR